MIFKATFAGLALLVIGASSAYASCTITGCPPGQSCQVVMIDGTTGQYQCVNDDPVPELDIMMIPAAMGAAGFLAYRARKKAQKKA